MSVLHEYICPNCDGKIQFDANSQNLKCPFCDTEFEPDAFNELNDAIAEEVVKDDNFNWEENDKNEFSTNEADGLISYLCNTCSGEIVTASTTAATNCPYCGNPVIIKSMVSGTLKPDCIIPFKLDKKQATEAYKKHITGKKLLPEVFKDKNHIDEIKGIYVPFWLYDASVSGSAQYKATTVRRWSDSNYNYTKTDHYQIFRSGNMQFSKIPADGSLKMPDDLMESIEPFNFSEAIDFSTAYLTGYFADKYDVTSNERIIRANERIKKSTTDTLMSTVSGYSTVIPVVSNVNMSDGQSLYALYPVWILNTTYNGEKYTFAMNGQTGKFVGDLPVDKGKLKKYFAISSLIGTLAGFAATVLFNLFT